MVSYHLEDVNEILKWYQELIIEHDSPDLFDILLEIIIEQSLTLKRHCFLLGPTEVSI